MAVHQTQKAGQGLALPGLIVTIAALLVSACGFKANILTREDPAYSPSKSDPVFVTAGVHSTIQDRQMLPLIKHEFEAEGFNLSSFENAKWVVVVGRDDRTVVTGVVSKSVGYASPLFGGAIGVSKSRSHEETERFGDIILSLLTQESEEKGDPFEVWQGTITTDPDQINDRPKTVIRALIDQYGKNYEDDVRLPRHVEKTYP